MDFGFVFSIFFYCCLLINEKVSAGPKNLEIIRDVMRVEKLAAQYANHKRTRRSLALKPFKNLWKNICDKEPEIKIEFCYRFLPMAYMGYTFDSWQENDLICVENKFWINHLDNQEVNNFDLEMYPCPNIKYRDLETDKDIIIPDKYHVSKGRKHDSAIVFFQKDKNNENDKVYPQMYINNIVFEKLTSLISDNKVQLLEEEPQDDPDLIIYYYGLAKKFRRTYDKFKKFFRSMNLCSLPRSHKIHVCRDIVRVRHHDNGLTLDLEGFDQYKCKKHLIEAKKVFQLGEFEHEDMQNYLLLCPPASKSSKQKTIEPLLYLSSTLRTYTVSTLTRNNNWDSKLYWRSVFQHRRVRVMVYDRRRVRAMKYPSQIERATALLKLQQNDLKDFEEKVNRMITSVQTPVAMIKSGSVSRQEGLGTMSPILITQKEPLVEDTLISYSKIKSMKFEFIIFIVYGRFMKTYWSLDICVMPHILQDALCDNILKNSPFKYYPTSGRREDSQDTNINRPCSRRLVNLGIREIDSMEAKYFSMWQCPKVVTRDGYFPIYYIGKYHLKNALLIFKTCDACEDENIIFPDAVATEIDRKDLARIMLLNAQNLISRL